MKTSKGTLLLGSFGLLSLATSAAQAQLVCNVSDNSRQSYTDCSSTTWLLGINYSDGNNEGSEFDVDTENGTTVCVSPHTACDGSSIGYKLYNATESITATPSWSYDDTNTFYWTIGNQSDSINECGPNNQYDETVYVGIYKYTGWYGVWCN